MSGLPPRNDQRSSSPGAGDAGGSPEPAPRLAQGAADPAKALPASPLLDERSLSKLRWRCRRGLLENDLFIERFFRRHEETITTRQAEGLLALMDLPDNDLLDLLLLRKQPQDELDTEAVREVLAQLRRPATQSLPQH